MAKRLFRNSCCIRFLRARCKMTSGGPAGDRGNRRDGLKAVPDESFEIRSQIRRRSASIEARATSIAFWCSGARLHLERQQHVPRAAEMIAVAGVEIEHSAGDGRAGALNRAA